MTGEKPTNIFEQEPETETGELLEADLDQASGGVGGSKCNIIVHD